MPPIAWVPMSAPVVVSVAPGSAAERAGLCAGDEVVTINGIVPRDIIEWQFAADEAELEIEVLRGGLQSSLEITKRAGEPLGAEVSSAVFDRVRTCDNHCEFCFIYQLPQGMRRSLYLKDDDYRLSFLYGNFTTLTRFTEADLERVITERLSPLNVSIHATDPDVRARMLKNPRGGMSLRWLRALLDHDIVVRGQVVLCPGVNDGAIFDRTMAGMLDEYPELESVAVVPLGLSRFNNESAMRLHTPAEAEAMVDAIEDWQDVFLRVLGRRMVFAADEYYLMAGRPFPSEDDVRGLLDARGRHRHGAHVRAGVQRSGEVADRSAERVLRRGRRSAEPCGLHRLAISACGTDDAPLRLSARRDAPVGILTGEFGARVLEPLIDQLQRPDVRIIPVANEFFGGNTAVTGLMVGADLQRVLATEPAGHRYLLPDVCLSEGRFLDGTTVGDLPRPVEVVATDGIALRRALEPAS